MHNILVALGITVLLASSTSGCGGNSEDPGDPGQGGNAGTGGTAGGGSGGGGGGGDAGVGGAGGSSAPKKVTKKIRGNFPSDKITVMDKTGDPRKAIKVKLKNPKTKKTVAVATIAANGDFEMPVDLYAEVNYVFIIEDAKGYAIGDLGTLPNATAADPGDVMHTFPLDPGGNEGPDTALNINLGAMRWEINDGEVTFLSETSPLIYVDTDEDGMNNFIDPDDDNDKMNDDQDDDDDNDGKTDADEDREAEAVEEEEEPADEGGSVNFVASGEDDTVFQESPDDQGVTPSEEAEEDKEEMAVP